MPNDMAEAPTYENPVPRAVRQASLAADAHLRQIGAQNVPPDPAPPAQPATPPSHETAPAPQPPPQQQLELFPPPAQPQAPPADWQARYLTLQGKYNTEMAELKGQITGLTGQIGSLQNLIATLNSTPRVQEAPAPASTTVVIDPKDVEDYGELVPKARAWARAEVAPELNQMRAELAQFKENHSLTQSANLRGRVDNALQQWASQHGIADFHTVDNDPRFVAWLQAVDPFAGQTRHAMLGQAYVNGDAARTVAFFDAWYREHTAIAGELPSGGASHTGVQTPAVRPTLETFAAPGRPAGQAPGSGAPSVRIWSQKDIAAFYDDRRRGRFRGREQFAAQLEADIFAAAGEGRIR